MFFLISFAIASILAIVLHGTTRRFVRNRLRYVDTVQKSIAPWAAGGAAFLIGAVLVPFLPLVGLGTALTAGLAVGSGVAMSCAINQSADFASISIRSPTPYFLPAWVCGRVRTSWVIGVIQGLKGHWPASGT